MAPRTTKAVAAEAPAADPDFVSTLPPPAHTLKGPDKERAAIWARQSKSGTINLCTFKEGEDSCYHPLTAVRDAGNSNDPKIEEVAKDGKLQKAIVHVCSWHKEAHGEQLVFPPKKEDEI